jgi:X-domain of DnaJ-containing
VLREVCDRILNDKTVRMEKRVERAHAMILCGTIYQKVKPPQKHIRTHQ